MAPTSDEDWVILKRRSGIFTAFVKVCPEPHIPQQGGLIVIKDFPVGLITTNSLTKVGVMAHRTTVVHYQPIYQENNPKQFKEMKQFIVKVVADDIYQPDVRIQSVLVVDGGRINGSSGAPYFCDNGTVVAIHFTSVDGHDDTQLDSLSGRSHASLSCGYVLCRLKEFKEWYEREIGPM